MCSKKPAPNIADHPRYLALLEEQGKLLFRAGRLESEAEEKIGFGYAKRTKYYADASGPYRLNGYESDILDPEGRIALSYRCYDGGRELCAIVPHAGGNLLFYNTDLYGYSVRNLRTGEGFCYIPKDVLDGKEAFIWTDVHYDAGAGLMAVDGCFWASPSSVFLYDMPNPLEPPRAEVDLRSALDPEYKFYNDVDFAGWDGGALRLLCMRADGSGTDEHALTVADCRRLLFEPD